MVMGGYTMPSNDPEYTNRTWARQWGGEYITPSRRDTKYNMVDHPLWAVRRIEDADLYDRIQYMYKNTGRCFPNDKMYIMNLHKHRIDINSDFVKIGRRRVGKECKSVC